MTDAGHAHHTTFDFTGKVAIVTGSAGGIGQAYAEALAAAGASVVVADIDAARAEAVAEGIRASGDRPWRGRRRGRPGVGRGHGRGRRGRVRRHRLPGQQRRHLRRHEARPAAHRRLGVPQPVPVGEHARRAQLRPGLLAGHERARGGGAIVNQSSTAAYLYAGFYGLAKAGVNSITQQLAHELGGDDIRTNAIAPGPIDTEASRTVVPDAFMKPILAGLALKRMGETSDLVGMCLFLLSDEASWITGHVFNVDGGQVVRP